MVEIQEITANMAPLFHRVDKEIPFSTTETAKRVDGFLKSLEDYQEIASKRFNDFYEQGVKLRTGENGQSQDNITIVIDSGADLAAMYTLAKTAKEHTIKNVKLIYARTNYHDLGTVAQSFFGSLKTESPSHEPIKISYLDALDPNDVDMKELFGDSSLVITNLVDSYDFRIKVNKYADANNFSIPEMPTLDMAACVSEAFSTPREEMKISGDKIMNILNDCTKFKLQAPDGTNLMVSAGQFINEATNDFTYRPTDYIPGNAALPVSIQDNYPNGEVWANAHQAEGTLVLYQIDTDVLKWAKRNKKYFDFDVNKINLEQSVYDGKDPIKLEIKDSKIVDIQGGDRATILRTYLKEQAKIDKEKTRGEDSPYLIAEIAWGINKGAKNPEVKLAKDVVTTSVLITEKAAKVPHIAFGNSPDYSPEEQPFVHESDTHIDNGIRNENLQIYGVAQDGTETLITSTVPGETGVIDRILDQKTVV